MNHFEPITTLEDLERFDPSLRGALSGASRDFFEPNCANIRFEVGPKALDNRTLQYLPNQPVSRAWDMVFRVVLGQAVNLELGRFREFRYDITPQTVPAHLVVEVSAAVNDDTRHFQAQVDFATAAANAVIPKARAQCEKEHDRLAADLGQASRAVGFQG